MPIRSARKAESWRSEQSRNGKRVRVRVAPLRRLIRQGRKGPCVLTGARESASFRVWRRGIRVGVSSACTGVSRRRGGAARTRWRACCACCCA